MRRVLFCNIAYLPHYDTELDRVAPINGGSYVANEGDALEKHNFEICDDGQCRGFVETKYHRGYKRGIALNEYNQMHIERIDPLAKNRDSLDNVLVVFCAMPKKGHSVIVGWYKNATVYRRRPSYGGRDYNLCAQKDDCCLLPEYRRTFKVPRATKDGIGFGQSNVWYASGSECRDYVESVIDYIDSYTA